MDKYIFLFLLLFITPNGYALDAVTFKLDKLEMESWTLEGFETRLKSINKKQQQLSLSLKKINLPKPFHDLKLFNIHCQKLSWGNNEIHCYQGKASLKSKRFDSPRLNFSFFITKTHTQFKISQFKVLKGTIDLQVDAKFNQWTAKINGKKAQLKTVHQLLFPKLKLDSGYININIKAKGNEQGVKKIKTVLALRQLTLQTKDGTKATEKLNLKTTVNLLKNKNNLFWTHKSVFKKGNLYIEPMYWENKDTPISLESKGYFNLKTQKIDVDKIQFTHPTVGFIKAYANVNLKPKFNLTYSKIYANIDNLEMASRIYLDALTDTTAVEGLTLKGRLEAGVTVKNNTPEDAYFITDKLQLKDAKENFKLQDGSISLSWSKLQSFKKTSVISWRQFDIYSIPLPSAYITLLLKDKQIQLHKKLDMPLFGGNLHIKQFDWQAVEDSSPKVIFSGKLKDISLKKLTAALGDEKPLTGNISGDIPSVQFEKGKLSLEGGLKINLFDGEININKLAISGLSTDFSQFYGDISIDNLDLDLLTQKFEFGGMKGRVSGYVRELYLENWKPIKFHTWIGTPENDNSTHQISQKAVENLASIGGGGAVDFVSRFILSLFDNFDYDSIGLGCYLHKNTCQLMGAEAAGERGFYIVKGGGLPRIDVMGYNTKIDWDVLLKRLQRISQSTGDAEVE